MVERIIELSVRHKWLVFGAVFAVALWAVDSVRKTPLASGPSVGETPCGRSCWTRPSCSSTRVRAQ